MRRARYGAQHAAHRRDCTGDHGPSLPAFEARRGELGLRVEGLALVAAGEALV